jgi:hypothetical protein
MAYSLHGNAIPNNFESREVSDSPLHLSRSAAHAEQVRGSGGGGGRAPPGRGGGPAPQPCGGGGGGPPPPQLIANC